MICNETISHGNTWWWVEVTTWLHWHTTHNSREKWLFYTKISWLRFQNWPKIMHTHNTQPSRTQKSYQNTFFHIQHTQFASISLFFLSLCNKSIHNYITRIPNYYITNHWPTNIKLKLKQPSFFSDFCLGSVSEPSITPIFIKDIISCMLWVVSAGVRLMVGGWARAGWWVIGCPWVIWGQS